MSNIDAKKFRNTCGKFATGITIVTSTLGNKTLGKTANGFMSVSLDPALIAISVGNKQKIYASLIENKKFGVSILNESQEPLSNHFAGKPDPDLEIKFNRIEGVDIIDETLAHFVADVVKMHEEGDHTLFIGEVKTCEINEDAQNPLIYFGGYKTLK